LPDFSRYNAPKREKYTKWPQNLPNGHYINIPFSHKIDTMALRNTNIFQDLPKLTQNWIFGLKKYHLATLWQTLSNAELLHKTLEEDIKETFRNP
jgi:hypothetical protein